MEIAINCCQIRGEDETKMILGPSPFYQTSVSSCICHYKIYISMVRLKFDKIFHLYKYILN